MSAAWFQVNGSQAGAKALAGLRVIDLFAGCGGFTEAAEQAGAQVVWAANHWPEAVETHAANHPATQHVCQDLRQANWTAVPAHDLMLASPACQGHSPARGKERPHHDATRATAFAIIDALDCHMPKAALIENVPAMLEWRLFGAWCRALNDLGYAVAPHVVDAADHGVPQHRERLMVVVTRSEHPLQLRFDPKPHVPASSFIRFDQGEWSELEREGRAASTLQRALNGRQAHGDQFLMPYYGSGSGKTGRALSRPIGTITTRDRWAVVNGNRMRMLSKDENRAAMGFPETYRLPRQHKLAVHMLGNAVPPPMARDFIAAVAAHI